MDSINLRHKMIFGKSKKIWMIIALVAVPLAVAITILFVALDLTDKYFGIIMVSYILALTSLILAVVFSINYNRYGSFYGIDVIDNKIIVVSEKKGETSIEPQDIEKIHFFAPLLRKSNINCSFYAKLKNGKKIGASYTISNYSELESKILLLKDDNNIPASFVTISG